MRDERHMRDDVHVTYRMGDGREAQTIVTESQRDALQRGDHLIADHGSSRLLASQDNWSTMFSGHLKSYPPQERELPEPDRELER